MRRLGGLANYIAGSVAAVVVVGLGLLIYALLTSEQNPTKSTEHLAAEAPSSNNVRQVEEEQSIGDLSRVVESIDDLEQFDSEYEKFVALRRLLRGSNEAKVVELLDQSLSLMSESFRARVQSEILMRFVGLDPRKALEHVLDFSWNRRAPLVMSLFGEWSSLDLDTAISVAKDLERYDKSNALTAILRTSEHLSRQARLEIARAFGREDITESIDEQLAIGNARENPEASWYMLVNDGKFNGEQTNLLETVARIWVERDGINAAQTIRQSLTDQSVLWTVEIACAEALAEMDPASSFQHVVSWSANASANASAISFVERWVQDDPIVALEAVAGLESRQLRNSLYEIMAIEWASIDAQKLFQQLAGLPEEFIALGQDYALRQIAVESPQDAARLLNEVESDDVRNQVAFEIAAYWSEKDVYQALEWVLSNFDNHKIRRGLLARVWPILVVSDAELAMQTALQQPIGDEDSQIGSEVDVLKSLAEKNVREAVPFLPQVREGPTKQRAYLVVGSALIRDKDSNAAIELGDQLTDEEQSRYFDQLIFNWGVVDPVGMYESIEKLPNDQLKLSAAEYLQRGDRVLRRLTYEQLNVLNELIERLGESDSSE